MKDLVTKRAAIESAETSATLIHAIIVGQYGVEAYDWDPATVYLELRADFDVEPSAEVMDKWSAIQVIMTTGLFFDRLDAFLGICNTLATGQPFFQVFDPVTAEEAAWAVTEVALNRDLLPFSYSIKEYVRRVLKADGYAADDFPTELQELFDAKPSSADIRRIIGEADTSAATFNSGNISEYVKEELADMVSQFNKIPSMRTLDDMILRRGMDEFIAKGGGNE